MTRLFLILAALNLTALLLTAAVGSVSKRLDLTVEMHGFFYVMHFSLGLFTAIGTLLVHCIIFTYFLGTGRWVKEVGLAYKFPDADLPKTTRELKRRVFPPALYAMLITIVTSAAGAGVQLQEWPGYVHLSLALITLLVNIWAFRIEYRTLQANAAVLVAVLQEVDRLRAAQGLPSNAESLAQELQR